jgi:4-carboxymuconolactone decarboxylase
MRVAVAPRRYSDHTVGDRFVFEDAIHISLCVCAREMKGTLMADVAQDTHETLLGISIGDANILETAIGLRDLGLEGSGLDARTYALVKIAALIALDAPPTSYAWQIGNALAEGVTPEDILGVLRAVAFQVGAPKVVAAAPEIMLALGLALPEEV